MALRVTGGGNLALDPYTVGILTLRVCAFGLKLLETRGNFMQEHTS